MSIEVNGKTYETDEEGYLINLADWTQESASTSPRKRTWR